MPLPDSYRQHLADAENRLANLKEQYGVGRISAAQIELECIFVQLDLQAATVILNGSIEEEVRNNVRVVDLGGD